MGATLSQNRAGPRGGAVQLHADLARGADAVTAEQQAWAQRYAVVRGEAMSASFIDNFWRLAWIVLFLGRRALRAEAPGQVEKHAVEA